MLSRVPEAAIASEQALARPVDGIYFFYVTKRGLHIYVLHHS